MEQVYLTFSGEASLKNISFYDGDDNTELTKGLFFYSSEGVVRYWPSWPGEGGFVIHKNSTQTFYFRANVIGRGAVSIKMHDLVVQRGSVEGLPSAIITLTVK